MSFLVIAALLGLIPAFIAQSKGRSFGGWWLYGFLLFIVAIIHVLFVPSLNSSVAAVADSQGPMRDCPYCAEPVKYQATKCKHCGSDVTPSKIIANTDNTGASDRLADVNVKLIAGIAITVFAVIIVAIMFYRQ